MTLGTLLDSIQEYDDSLTIYASKEPAWTDQSEAVVALAPDDGSIPAVAKGLSYLLEVCVAKEVLSVWSTWRSGAQPGREERCDAVIHYATHDSYLQADASV